MSRQILNRALYCCALGSLILLQSGCVSISRTIVQQPDETARHDGLWRSDGYGYILDLRGGNVALYHVTDQSCVKSKTIVADLSHYLDRGAFQAAENGRTGEFKFTLEEHPIGMRRIGSIPSQCDTPNPDTPLGNFDAFAAFFAQHYAFFELYDTDWSKRVADARPLINAATSDAALFEVFSDMLAPIKDGHVSVLGVVDGKAREFEANRSVISRSLAREAQAQGISHADLSDRFFEGFWLHSVGGDILHRRGKMVADNRIQYGMVTGDVAYINFLTAAGFAGKGAGNEQNDLATLNRVLNDALDSFENEGAKALIIDLSVNMGGYDFIARAIANRFADRRVLAYTKQASDSSSLEPFAYETVPYGGSRFAGPIYVVTSQSTVSAGEVLTMALRALPQVTHVGQPTRGAFSDVLEKELPNGWKITLSNEVYRDAEGNIWEARGIEPDMPMTVFGSGDLIESHQNAIMQLARSIATTHSD